MGRPKLQLPPNDLIHARRQPRRVRQWGRGWFATAVAAAVVGPWTHDPAVAAAPKAAQPAPSALARRSPPTTRDIAWWVRCLGDPRYKVREAASKALTAAGSAAKSELLKALDDPDPEIRRRARLILVDVLEIDFRARLDAFVADTTGVGHHELPGWVRYRAIVGNDASARQLFAEMLRAEPGLLEAAESGPEAASQALQARCEQLQQALRTTIRTTGIAALNRISVGSIAALMFVAADENVPLSQQTASSVGAFCYQQPFQQAVNGTQWPLALRKLTGAWVKRSVAANPANAYTCMMLALRYDLKEGLEPALEMIKNTKLSPNVLLYPILVIGKLGSPRQVAAVAPLLTDTRVCAQQRFNNNTHVDAQIRDVALAVLVRLTGQELKDYGFRRAQDHRTLYLNAGSLGFATQSERDAALKKWDQWVAAKRIEQQKKAAKTAISPVAPTARSQ